MSGQPPETDQFSKQPGLQSVCRHGRDTHGAAAGDELRCGCGSLLARYVANGVELKCRRCKRTVVIEIAASEEATVI